VAKKNESPKLDVQAGAQALDGDIPRVLKVKGVSSLEELGWSRPNRLSLLVPMLGTFQGKTDEFLLRLGFQAYRQWPPSAQFVNPDTLQYAGVEDQRFVPKLTSGECHTHVAYQRDQQSKKIQLICCSATLEFYEVLHNVEDHHLWRDTDTFLTTINAIQKAFASSYGGRF
jgi:hypothetical protein